MPLPRASSRRRPRPWAPSASSSTRIAAIRVSTRSPSSRVALAHPRRRRRNPSSHSARRSVPRPARERRSRARGSGAKVSTSVWTLGSPSKVPWVCRGRLGRRRGITAVTRRGDVLRVRYARRARDHLHRAPGSTHRARRAPRRHPPLKQTALALFRVTLRITGGRVRGDAARTSRYVCIRCAGDSARASNAAARATTSASNRIRRAVRVLAVQRAHARARPRKR